LSDRASLPPGAAEPGSWLNGVALYPQWLDRTAQAALLDDLRAVARAAPLFTPETRFGKPMSVQMTSAGGFGWYSDRRGYRYIDRHPSGTRWPPIPGRVSDIWHRITGLARTPDCCCELRAFNRGHILRP
jgi:alkylated DNA repair protein (DNA oxidative demethylase)